MIHSELFLVDRSYKINRVHNDLLKRSGNGELEVGDLSLLVGGVYNNLAVNKTHEHATDGAVPRNVGDGKSDGCTDHCGDLRRAVGVNRHDGEKKGDVVTKILGEKGSYRTVDNSACENCLLRGLTLTLEEAAGNLTYRIHLLIIVNRERKEVDALTGSGGCGCGCEYGGLAVLNEGRTVAP